MRVNENETCCIHNSFYYLDNNKKEHKMNIDDDFYKIAIHSFKYVSVYSYHHEKMNSNEFYKVVIFSNDNDTQSIYEVINNTTDLLENYSESECSFKCVLNTLCTLNL